MIRKFKPGDIVKIIDDAQFLYFVPTKSKLKIINIHEDNIEVEYYQNKEMQNIYGVFIVIPSTIEHV